MNKQYNLESLDIKTPFELHIANNITKAIEQKKDARASYLYEQLVYTIQRRKAQKINVDIQ